MSASDASLQSFLQSELLVLANETRKKHPEVKTAVDEALALIKESKAQQSLNMSQDLHRSDHKSAILMRPLRLSATNYAANTRLLAVSINILHRLLSHDALHRSAIPNVLLIVDTVIDATGINAANRSVFPAAQSAELQLKALQCILPLYTNYDAGGLSEEVMWHGYECCLRLHESRAPMVTNAAVAIVRQLVIFLFDAACEEAKSSTVVRAAGRAIEAGKEELPTKARQAFTILQDTCLLANDEPALALVHIRSIERVFALELVESILSNHALVFQQYEAFVTLLKDRLCTLAVRILTERAEFPLSCRLWRVVGLVLKSPTTSSLLPVETEIMLSFAVRILDDASSAIWERALVVETIGEVFSDPATTTNLYRLCDMRDDGVQIVADAVNAVCRLIQSRASACKDERLEMRVSCLHQFDKTTAPLVPESYLLAVAFECISSLLDSMLASTNSAEHGSDLRLLFGHTYPAILRALISLHAGPAFEQRLLSAVKNFIVLASRDPAALKTAIDAVSELVLQPTLRPSSAASNGNTAKKKRSPIVERRPACPYNLQTAKALMSAVLVVADSIVDWHPVVQAMYAVEQLAAQSASFDVEEGVLEEVLALHRSTLALHLPDATFERFVDALTSITPVDTDSVHWTLQRVKSVYAHRMPHLVADAQPAGWTRLADTLGEHLRAPLNSPLQLLARDTLMSMLQLYVDAFKSGKCKDASSQKRPFELIAALRCELSTVLEAMHLCLQGIGDSAPAAWPLILSTLARVQAEAMTINEVPLLFGTVKLICGDFLDSLTVECCLELVSVVSCFFASPAKGIKATKTVTSSNTTDANAASNDCSPVATMQVDLNAALTSIGMLWDIVDSRSAVPSPTSSTATIIGDKEGRILMLVLNKLLCPATTLDARFEVRNSAIPTAFRILQRRLSELGEPRLGKKVRRLISDMIAGGFDARSTSVAHEDDQWDETLSLMLNGCTDLWCQYYADPRLNCRDLEERWREQLAWTVDLYCHGPTEKLVETGVDCMARLAAIDGLSPSLLDLLWSLAWLPAISDASPFTQDTLIKLVGLFRRLRTGMDGRVDAEWIDRSLSVLTRAITFSSRKSAKRMSMRERLPKDRDAPSELQRACIACCEELEAGTHSNTVIRLYAEWMQLCLQYPLKQGAFKNGGETLDGKVFSRSCSITFSGSEVDLSIEPQATFIGLAGALLERLDRLVLVHDIGEPVITAVVDGLHAFIRQKYHSPRPGTTGKHRQQLWRLAAGLLVTLSRRHLDGSSSVTPGLRQLLVATCADFIRTTRRQDPPPHPTMLTEAEFADDEQFECSFVASFIPSLRLDGDLAIVDALAFASVFAVSRYSPDYADYFEDDAMSEFDVIKSFLTRDSAMACKERFVAACLSTLLQSPLVPFERKIARARSCLDRFLDEKASWGPLPLPRQRHAELAVVLDCARASEPLLRQLYAVLLKVAGSCERRGSPCGPLSILPDESRLPEAAGGAEQDTLQGDFEEGATEVIRRALSELQVT